MIDLSSLHEQPTNVNNKLGSQWKDDDRRKPLDHDPIPTKPLNIVAEQDTETVTTAMTEEEPERCSIMPSSKEKSFQQQLVEMLIEDPDQFRRTFAPALAASLANAMNTQDMNPVEKQDIAFSTFREALKDILDEEKRNAILIKEDSTATFDSSETRFQRGLVPHTNSRRNLLRSTKQLSVKRMCSNGLPSQRTPLRSSIGLSATLSKTSSRRNLARSLSAVSISESDRSDSLMNDAVVAALEDEIFDLEDEIVGLKKHVKKQKRRHNELSELFQDQRKQLLRMEDKYALLKVELAEAQASLDDVTITYSEQTAERDLKILNLTLERDQLRCNVSRIIKDKDAMTLRVASLEDSVGEKNARMLTLVTERETMMEDLRRMNRTLESLTVKVERYEELESREKADKAYEKGHRQRSRRSLLSRFGFRDRVEAAQ